MYKIVVTEYFKRQLKRLVKRNRALKKVFIGVLSTFKKETAIAIGSGVYKLRLKGHSRGKSGGYRVYIFVMEVEGVLAPICIYAKNEKENLTYKEMARHLKNVKVELARLL